jgi:hypothetical protein
MHFLFYLISDPAAAARLLLLLLLQLSTRQFSLICFAAFVLARLPPRPDHHHITEEMSLR